MKQDIFDRLGPDKDIFDRLQLDIETLLEKKLDLTPETSAFIEKAISGMLADRMGKLDKVFNSSAKSIVSSAIEKAAVELKNELAEREEKSSALLEDMKKQIAKLEEMLRKKGDELRNQITASQDRYQFGGFSPQFNDLNIGLPSVEGAWRIVKNGTDLEFQRLESNVWTLKGSFTP